jgi:ribosome biogenesis GTPase
VLTRAGTREGGAASELSGRRIITGVLPRRSLFARKRPGSSGSQPLVANLDLLVIVTDPAGDFSISRVVRFVEALRTGCDAPVLLAVNKADLVTDAAARAAEARAAIPGIDACAISARSGEGIADLRARWSPGDTIALAGSSGVGKSTLVNALCGVSVGTATVRGDGRGRHTTTARRAYATSDGALLIDTPGMREVGIYGGDAEAGTGFTDIEELAEGCRYRDCRHEREPGCAVLAAVSEGRLARDRYESYLELRRETETTAAEHRERKRRWEKEIAREMKRMRKQRDQG